MCRDLCRAGAPRPAAAAAIRSGQTRGRGPARTEPQLPGAGSGRGEGAGSGASCAGSAGPQRTDEESLPQTPHPSCQQQPSGIWPGSSDRGCAVPQVAVETGDWRCKSLPGTGTPVFYSGRAIPSRALPICCPLPPAERSRLRQEERRPLPALYFPQPFFSRNR